MSQLRLFLLGPPRIELDGRLIVTNRRKVLALHIYLALNPAVQQRDFLANLLWPTYDQTSARANLRKTISLLKRQLTNECLEIQREQIRLIRSGDFWLDVDQFRTLLDNCLAPQFAAATVSPSCFDDLNQAAGLYRGDFLTGFSLPDSPEFTDWQMLQAENLRRNLARLLDTLSQGYAAQSDWEPAIAATRRWLSLDTLEEAAHRQLMRLLVSNGQRQAALRQYEQCRQVLAEELEVEPAVETQSLFAAIKSGELSRAEPLTPGPIPGPAGPRINLPSQLTTFVGRYQEVAEIKRLLEEEPACRQLTLFGPGGVGKTRLAIKAAAAISPRIFDRIAFVPLAAINHLDSLIPAIADVLGIRLTNSAPREIVLNSLRDEKLLLILDNFEHLISLQAAELLGAILTAAPQVKLLVTSRHRLNLAQEWSVEILGMKLPAVAAQDMATVEKNEAVQLFVQRARRVRHSFALSAENFPDVIRICHLLAGMPLALELAAAWLRLFSCQEIRQRIEQSFDFLAGSYPASSERHHSLRTVFEDSWRLLSAEEQDLLRKLSLFRGGFSDRAAQRVMGANDLLLVALVDKALLRRTQSRRYQMHEQIRQFAAEKLDQFPDDREQSQAAHAEFFLTFVQQIMDKWGEKTKAEQRGILEAFVADGDNVWQAWYHALDRRQDHLIGKAAVGLYNLCHLTGWLLEGYRAFRQAVNALPEASADPLVVGRLLRGYGFIHTWLGNLAQAKMLLERSVALLKRVEGESPADLAHSLYELSMSCWVQGLYAQTARHAQASLRHSTVCGDQYQMGLATQMLGWVKTYQGEYEAGITFIERSIPLLQTRDGTLGLRGVYSKQFLAIIARFKGEFQKAIRIIEELFDEVQAAGHSLDLGYLLRELGYLNIALGHYDLAQAQVERGSRIFKEMGARAANVLLATQLGEIHRLKGAYRPAQRLHEEALVIGREIGERRGVAICLENLGRLANAQDDHEKAKAFFLDSLAVYEQIGHRHGQATVLCQLGITHLLAGESDRGEAGQRLQRGLEISTAIGATPLTLAILYGYALLWSLEATGQARHKAGQLLRLIISHGMSEQETKDRARQLHDRLVANWPADLPAGAGSGGQPLDLGIVTQEILTGISYHA